MFPNFRGVFCSISFKNKNKCSNADNFRRFIPIVYILYLLRYVLSEATSASPSGIQPKLL